MSGLGERGKRLRRIAAALDPPPVAIQYVQLPDEQEIRAIGWHMWRRRGGPPEYLGYSAPAAEVFLRAMIAEANKPKRRSRGSGTKSPGK